MDAFDVRPPGSIKSIQRGVVSAASPALVTISPVNTNKAVLSFLGGNTGGTALSNLPYIALTSATVLTVSASGYNTSTLSWQIVEYY
jgi:hypothetical protein